MLIPTWMFMDCMRKETYQCAQYKLKIVYKAWQQKQTGKFYKNIKFLASRDREVVKTFPLMYQLPM